MSKKRNPNDGPLWNPAEDRSPVHDIDDVTPTFRYSAMLRIYAESLDFEEIESQLGLSATGKHRRGDRRRPKSSTVFMHDMWQYQVAVSEGEPLEAHIDALWADIRQAKPFLLSLKDSATVDVFLGYRSDWLDGGVEVPHGSLQMFIELEMPFYLSIVRI
jgi:hypothetical protein